MSPAPRTSSEERQTRACAGLCSLVAVVLLCVGAALTRGSGYEAAREDALRRYDSVVDAWNERYALAFNATAWSVLIDDVEFALEGRGDEDQDGADADAAASDDASRPRVALRMALPGSLWDVAPTSVIAAWAEVAAESSSSAEAEASNPSEAAHAAAAAARSWAQQRHNVTLLARRGGQRDALSLLLSPLLERVVLPDVTSWKECRVAHLGVPASGNASGCVTFQAVHSLCACVSQDGPDGAWRLDERFGGAGCGPEAQWRVVTRLRVQPGSEDGAEAPSWGALRRAARGALGVRSAEDPLLWALHETDGSMVFAAAQASRDAAGRLVLVVAGLAALVAALLGAPPLLAALAARGAPPLLRMRRRARGEALLEPPKT